MSLTNTSLYCWFKSNTRIGVVHIGIEANATERQNLDCPHRVFQQAALVSNTELLIQAFELWQQVELDLVPCDPPADTAVH